jgi:PIN domain nuclease of toxin-antitoxin system
VQELWTLPDLHRDPFDRMLIAQASAEGLTLVTADEMVRAYPVKTLGA